MSEHYLPFQVQLKKCSKCGIEIDTSRGTYYFETNGIITCNACYTSNTLEIPVSRFEFEALKQEIEKLKEEVENLKNVRP